MDYEAGADIFKGWTVTGKETLRENHKKGIKGVAGAGLYSSRRSKADISPDTDERFTRNCKI